MHRFEEFIRSRRFLKNVTAKTIIWYESSFAAFTKYHPKDEYTAESLRAFLITLRQSGLSPISCNTYCRAVNAYLRWLHDEGFASIVLKIPPLKTEHKVLPTFSPIQVRSLLSWKAKTFGEHRMYALLCLLLDTGLRIEEVLTLTRQRVDLDNMLVTVLGKGQKERVVPISFELRKILYRWLLKNKFPLAFPARHGGRMSQRNLLRDFKALGKKLAVNGVRVSFHTLRHTFAVNYIRNGGDVFRLQRILGHSTLEMTRRYVNLQTEDLQSVHNKLSLFAQQSR